MVKSDLSVELGLLLMLRSKKSRKMKTTTNLRMTRKKSQEMAEKTEEADAIVTIEGKMAVVDVETEESKVKVQKNLKPRMSPTCRVKIKSLTNYPRWKITICLMIYRAKEKTTTPQSINLKRAKNLTSTTRRCSKTMAKVAVDSEPEEEEKEPKKASGESK